MVGWTLLTFSDNLGGVCTSVKFRVWVINQTTVLLTSKTVILIVSCNIMTRLSPPSSHSSSLKPGIYNLHRMSVYLHVSDNTHLKTRDSTHELHTPTCRKIQINSSGVLSGYLVHRVRPFFYHHI